MIRAWAGILLLAMATVVTNLPAQTPPAHQAVTYSDFSHINDIASSLYHVYFATTYGITSFDKRSDTWAEPLTGGYGVDHRDIQRIWSDLFDDALYVETTHGLWEYDPLFDQWYARFDLPNFQNQGRHIAAPDVMYAPFGLVYIDKGVIQDEYNRRYVINDVLDDQSGYLWLSVWGRGAARAGKGAFVMEMLPFGLIQPWVNTIVNEDGRLWVAGETFDAYRTGITILDPDRQEFEYIETGADVTLPAVEITQLAVDSEYIYLATERGLYFLDRETRRVSHVLSERRGLLDDAVTALAANGDSLFVGTPYGLTIVRPAGDSLRYSIPGTFDGFQIHDVHVVDSTAWVGTNNGAYRYQLTVGKLQRFQDPESILFSHVYDIGHFEHELWAVSDDGALRLNLETGETMPVRLRNRGIIPRAIDANDEVAVIGSDRGLTLVYHREDPPVIRQFVEQDGLASRNVLAVLLDGDFVWIGSDAGLTRFLWNNPDRVD